VKVPDIDAVSAALDEVAAEVVLPRFRNLEAADVIWKPTESDPEDIVTVADRETEEWLTRFLTALVPSAQVIGEEAAHRDPRLLRLIDSDDPVWVLDPIDGTKNFARGSEDFGIMLAFVAEGLARAAWIFLPAQGERFVAETGSGAFRNGARVTVPPADPGPDATRGTFHVGHMPTDLARSVSHSACDRFEVVAGSGAAAVAYTEVLCGKRDFDVYHRLFPWDHAPGALILTEGGGRVDHLDGAPYRARSADQVTVVARDAQVSTQVRAWLRPLAL